MFRLLFSVWQYIAVAPDEGFPLTAEPQEIIHIQEYQPAMWQVVSQQHWFGVPTRKTESMQTPPESPFRAVLYGITWGTRPAVVIEEEGRQQMYLEGDVLTSSGAKIIRIAPQYVQLLYAGKIRCLDLPDEASKKGKPMCPRS